jgi:hypothetical protein
VQEESNTVLIQDVPARADTIAIDTPLGTDSAHTDVVDPRSEAMLQPPCLQGACLDLVVCSPGPRLPRSSSLGDVVSAVGPWALRIQELPNWGC